MIPARRKTLRPVSARSDSGDPAQTWLPKPSAPVASKIETFSLFAADSAAVGDFTSATPTGAEIDRDFLPDVPTRLDAEGWILGLPVSYPIGWFDMARFQEILAAAAEKEEGSDGSGGSGPSALSPENDFLRRLAAVLQPPLAALVAPSGVLDWPAPLLPYQREGIATLLSRRELLLADDMGLGKCLGPDTPLYINGTLIRAEDAWMRFAGEAVSDGEGEWAIPKSNLRTNSLAYGEERETIVEASLTRLYRQWIKETVRSIRLEDGTEITVTRRHKLLGKLDWTNDLKAGDYVCVPSRLIWQGSDVDADLTTLLAWQIAEGYEVRGNDGRLNITQKEERTLEMLRECIHRVGQKFNLQVNQPKIVCYEQQTPHLRIVSKAYRLFLESKGYLWGKLSAEKRIPDFLMVASEETIRLFLREFFSAEGSVAQKMRCVEISSASRLLMFQLVAMLRRFGIWMRVSARQKRATNGRNIARTYYIGLIGGGSLRLFLQYVGFSDVQKQRKLEEVCKFTANTNVEGIPAHDLLAEMRTVSGLPYRHFGCGTVYFNGSQGPSRETAGQITEALDRILCGDAESAYRRQNRSKWTEQTLALYRLMDRERLTQLRTQLNRMTNREVFYCRITEIKEFEYEGWVYDYEIEKRHNFVTIGPICHNTIQAIAALRLLAFQQQITSALVVCPASLLSQWRRELARWAAELRVVTIVGSPAERGSLWRVPAHVKLISYETLRADVMDLADSPALRETWSVVVLDEASRIKNRESAVSMACMRLPRDRRWALTGTPLENQMEDVLALLEFLRGELGKRLRIEPGRAALKAQLQEVQLRRKKEDVLADLPPKQVNELVIELPPAQRAAYDRAEREGIIRLTEAGASITVTHVLELISHLKQLCNVDPVSGESAKLADIAERLRTLVAQGHRALVFSQFTDARFGVRRAAVALKAFAPLLFTGDMSPAQRTSTVDRFLTDSRHKALLLSLRAGGVGLNLQAASYVFHLDRWWNPAIEEQADSRAHRMGQRYPVTVFRYVCLNTIEERIDATLKAKRKLFQDIVEDVSLDLAATLSEEELFGLFGLPGPRRRQ